MSLEEYIGEGKNSFTYDVEYNNEFLHLTKGARKSKWGIYKNDGKYEWAKKYGSQEEVTKKEVFKKN